MSKFIFYCEPEDFILAGRAIKAAIRDNSAKGGVLYEFGSGQRFFVEQNRASLSVRAYQKQAKERLEEGV